MAKILIIQGHPDSSAAHFGHALAEAYATGAAEGGHAVRRIAVAALDFPLLRSKADWETGTAPADILAAQADILWAEHLVIVYPLWLGAMPALLKGFLEQVARPGFAISKDWKRLLAGRSARIIVTMGMPAPLYRFYFFAHGLKNLERNILGFCGIGPIRATLLGMIETRDAAWREDRLSRMRKLGRQAR